MANKDKIIQLIDSTETYTYGKNEKLIHKKGEFKCISIIKENKKMITYVDIIKENIKYQNPNLP